MRKGNNIRKRTEKEIVGIFAEVDPDYDLKKYANSQFSNRCLDNVLFDGYEPLIAGPVRL